LDFGYRITFFGDEIESIDTLEILSGKRIGSVDNAAIFPAALYLAPKEMINQVISEILDELRGQVDYFKASGKFIEAQRLSERVNYDIEMIKEF
jgi:excinuclease ABC subunit B